MQNTDAKVVIVGGKSSPGKITIYSDKFTSQATYRANKIQVKVKRRNQIVVSPTSKKEIPAVLQHPAIALSFFASVWEAIISSKLKRTQKKSPLKNMLPLIGMLLFIKRFVAKWHGAEHMAIEAYWRDGETSLEAIKKHSPINRYCGGRYFAPMLGLELLTNIRRVPAWIKPAGVCAIFELDKKRQILQKPPFVKLGHLLQKYLTTAVPGERELQTAQTAMIALIEAHRNDR